MKKFAVNGCATIRITNLRLRCIIGSNDDERDQKQDVIINLEIEFDASKVIESDRLDDTVNYKKISKAIIALVESSSFFMLERLAKAIADTVMIDPRIQKTAVRIDKPGALRFADSVSVELVAER